MKELDLVLKQLSEGRYTTAKELDLLLREKIRLENELKKPVLKPKKKPTKKKKDTIKKDWVQELPSELDDENKIDE